MQAERIPIFTLSRRKKPYKVHPPQYTEFLNFKGLSLRDEENNAIVNCCNTKELMVSKDFPSSIFFKTSHNDSTYKTVYLRRK